MCFLKINACTYVKKKCQRRKIDSLTPQKAILLFIWVSIHKKVLFIYWHILYVIFIITNGIYYLLFYYKNYKSLWLKSWNPVKIMKKKNSAIKIKITWFFFSIIIFFKIRSKIYISPLCVVWIKCQCKWKLLP